MIKAFIRYEGMIPYQLFSSTITTTYVLVSLSEDFLTWCPGMNEMRLRARVSGQTMELYCPHHLLTTWVT